MGLDKEILSCRSEVELYHLAIRRGYKHPSYWARKRWEGREMRSKRLKNEPPVPKETSYRNYYEPEEL